MKNRNVTFTTIFLALACFGLLPQMQAVVPPPDGCYPGLTTAEGCNALASLTTGIANTAVGWFSQHAVMDGSYNTAVGAGALDLNNANENTAVGTGALLLNTTGANNTAVGAFALINNTDGNGSTAHSTLPLEPTRSSITTAATTTTLSAPLRCLTTSTDSATTLLATPRWLKIFTVSLILPLVIARS